MCACACAAQVLCFEYSNRGRQRRVFTMCLQGASALASPVHQRYLTSAYTYLLAQGKRGLGGGEETETETGQGGGWVGG
jgi:hypothetical protein